MRRTLLVATLAALLLPAIAHAQQRPRLQIGAVRVGFLAGNPTGDTELEKPPLFKAGTWAPVLIDINVGPPGLKGNEGPLEITIETPDADDVATNYTVTRPLDQIGPNGTFTVTAYTKLASTQSDITVTLKGPDTVVVGAPYKRQHSGIPPGQALFLTVGGRIPGLRQTLQDADRQQNNPNTFNVEGVGFIDRFQDLPEQWYGYDGVDLLILSTTRLNDFLLEMGSEQAPRRRCEALVEWVRRGGHLAVSVGKNYGELKNILELGGDKGLLPVTYRKTGKTTALHLVWPDGLGAAGGAVSGPRPAKDKPPPTIEVAIPEPKPGRTYKSLLLSRDELRAGEEVLNDVPLILQSPYGLGRVTVVNFDLDNSLVAGWKGQNEFWPRLLEQASGRAAANVNANEDIAWQMRGRYAGDMNEPNELIYQFQGYLENFEEVPVISFGWVALFILIYILVVGPLDYFFLKKVVKRLELTWITFPTVVIVVSAVAYFTAYQLKGHDLRIRKLDVVDVDLQAQQTVGRTWFTVFSPRIQHYTIGIEPAAPTWAPEGADSSVLVSWMERPVNDMYGRRSRGQSLFRRAYDYEKYDPTKNVPANTGPCTGLKGVPIQVWSTKSFAASWLATYTGAPPLVAASLKHPPADAEALSGEITWLPTQPGAEIQDAVLIYRGRVVDVPLVAGTPKRVETLRPEFEGKSLNSWARAGAPQTNPGTQGYRGYAPPSNSEPLVRAAMFYQALESPTQRNSALRPLDQTWRAREGKDEAILVVRLKTQQDTADVVTQSPASASRVWLGALPSAGAQRPPLVGMMRQDTYVRVFIPVQATAK